MAKVWKYLLLLLIVSLAVASSDSLQLLERDPFDIPLAKLSVSFDDATGKFDRVRITFIGSDDQVIISRYNDTYIKNTRGGREKSIYRETPEKAYYLTDFEARHISRVLKTLIATLETFEKDLQKERWGRCLYLDAYLPRFLRGFNFLLCASRNTPDALPRIAKIPPSEYDVSLNSPKSDARIGTWQKSADNVVKLRIVTKELIFQARQWQKKELNVSNRNPEISCGDSFEEAFALFIRVYFNVKPPVELPITGKR